MLSFTDRSGDEWHVICEYRVVVFVSINCVSQPLRNGNNRGIAHERKKSVLSVQCSIFAETVHFLKFRMFSFLRTAMDYFQSASGLKVKPRSAEVVEEEESEEFMKRVASSRKSELSVWLLTCSALACSTYPKYSPG